MFPQIFGKYILVREIAAGGMARVLLATLRGAGGFEKRLVVKQIRPELASDQSFIGRFVAEAKTAVELSHTNIVPVYELGVEQGTYYIAMEFCEGVPLSQLLSFGALSPAEGAYIGVEICRALDYAHRKAGIVHRDVTPRNVMIDPEGMVRLIDFGIAAPVSHEATGGQGPLFGSPGHMPPEQLRHGPLTPAADVFAAAALLVEAWTGTPPFRRESFEASTRALTEPLPDLDQSNPELSPLAALLKTALALDPQLRPQTAEELARPLREFLREYDLGDIARRLGARVSARLTRPPDAPRSPGAKDRSSRATGAGVTQTFAVRDALLEWTAKIDSQPPAATPSPISGVVIESGGLPPSSRASSLSRASGGAAARRRRWAGAALVLGTLALLSLWLVQSALNDRRKLAEPGMERALAGVARGAAAAPAPSARELAVEAAPAAAPALEAQPSARAPALPGVKTSIRAPRTTAASPSDARTPAAEPRGASSRDLSAPKIRVQVTAEPPALVHVDAALVGRTPLTNLALSPGRHEFVFSSEQLGEKLEAQLTLDAATSHRVHADFTSATPQVYLR